MTQYLGFPHYGDEYKVMGLAPYGEPRFVDRDAADRAARRTTAPSSSTCASSAITASRSPTTSGRTASRQSARCSRDALDELLGPARDRRRRSSSATRHRALGAGDVRGGVLPPAERAARALRRRRRRARRRLRITRWPTARSLQRTPFKRLYVQAAPAMPAARSARPSRPGTSSAAPTRGGTSSWTTPTGARVRRRPTRSPMLDRRAPRRLRRGRLHASSASPTRRRCARARPQAIADGKVVGWFQGRMEWGPRALGNRSILGDPRRADMKDILNLKIKRRESFRPFAPSVLREAVRRVVRDRRRRALHDAGLPDPRGQARADPGGDPRRRHRAACRPSPRRRNPRYYRLIEAFRDITGVPMVLNTSFNENEPVVCRPEEALDCFLRTKMDVLVLGDTLIRR